MKWRRPEYFTDPYYGLAGWLVCDSAGILDGEVLLRLRVGSHPNLVTRWLPTVGGALAVTLDWSDDVPQVVDARVVNLIYEAGDVTQHDYRLLPLAIVRIAVSDVDLPEDVGYTDPLPPSAERSPLGG